MTRLCRVVPSDANYRVYFDNYFNSPGLQVSLTRRGIQSLGTVRINRVPMSQMPTEKTMRQKGRGWFVEKSAAEDGVTLSLVSWYDNRIVNFLSTFCGSEPVSDVRRWSRSDGCYISVPCPQIVKTYNKHMGGVDLMDSLIGLHRTTIRSKKWYHRIFYHLSDMMVVNAWLLYRKQDSAKAGGKPLKLAEFKASVANSLCSTRLEKERKRGRPSDVDQSQHQQPTKRRVVVSAVPADIRTDGNNHLPVFSKRGRCRRGKCKGTSRVACSKCKVALCLTAKKNCFALFHQ